jgi:hypothetical protein
VVTLALAATSFTARASNYSIYLEPGYLYDVTEAVDSTGRGVVTYRNAILQNYRLGVDLDLSRNLILSGSGTFLDTSNWVNTDGVHVRYDQPTVVAFGRLTYSTPLLSSGLQYDYNQQWGTLLGLSRASETATAYANWRPLELPQIDFRLSRSHNYDVLLTEADNVVWYSFLGVRYMFRALELRYYLNWIENQDRLSGVTTSSIDNLIQATYSDSYFNSRVSAYATAIFATRSLTTTFSSPGATVPQQQFPLQGLSLVETFPNVPTNETLAPNPALIDGNLLAPAGINVGFGPALAGDRDLRAMGVELPPIGTKVNLLYVWVDRRLPSEVVNGLVPSMSVYSSSDNVRWSPVPLSGPVVFGAFNNRFEIPVAETTAQYVKVVMSPLLPGVTNDRAFSDIQVTELQVFDVVLASSVPPKVDSYAVQASGTLKAGILRGPNLDYDLSLNFNRQSVTGFQSYTIVNGLSLNARLGGGWSILSRVARQDYDPGGGHESQWQWSASLVARPIPTLYAALSYSGQLSEILNRQVDPPVPASTMLQSITLFGRADLYEGVSLQATVGGTNGLDVDERATTSATANTILSLVPNRWVSLNTGFSHTRTWSYGGFLPDSQESNSRLIGTLIATPIPALSASVTATWLIQGIRPSVYTTVQLTYSPLQGDLQFGLAYNRTLDTATGVVTQFVSPTIRWTIRSGVFLNLSYIHNDTLTPALETRSRTATATLIIVI